jgi:tight adherence protein B
MRQAGLAEVSPVEFAASTAVVAMAGAAVGCLLFGGMVAAVALGGFAATVPVAAYRRRRAVRRELAEEAWPAMIDEVRILCGAAGRSIPQALLDVGERGPVELRPAFVAARRTWAITTDFATTVGVLKDHLASPTADAACETLLVAHELGGGDLDRRLAELAEDRRVDVAGRKDARSKQAGVRFARRFVVLVPLGMAVAGLSLGNGRASYQTPAGQILVAIGLGLVAACWVWSGRILRLPVEDRVFR